MPTAIYLIEDHLLLQRLLSEFIHKLPELRLCGVASSGQEALCEIPKAKPELVLVDISLPDINGLELVAQLYTWCPGLPLLMFSSYRDEYYVKRALAAGARGYLVKGGPLELVEAIRQVLNGEIYLSPELATP